MNINCNVPQRKIREAAFQILFAHVHVDQTNALLSEMLGHTLSISQEHMEEIFNYVHNIYLQIPVLDPLIEKNFETEWPLLSLADKTIVYLISYELLYEQKLDVAILLAEAIRLAKKFAHPHAYKFIHVIIDSLVEKEKTKV